MLATLRASLFDEESAAEGLAGLFGLGGKDESPADQFASWLPYVAYLTEEQLFVNRDGIGFLLAIMPHSGAGDRMVAVQDARRAMRRRAPRPPRSVVLNRPPSPQRRGRSRPGSARSDLPAHGGWSKLRAGVLRPAGIPPGPTTFRLPRKEDPMPSYSVTILVLVPGPCTPEGRLSLAGLPGRHRWRSRAEGLTA